MDTFYVVKEWLTVAATAAGVITAIGTLLVSRRSLLGTREQIRQAEISASLARSAHDASDEAVIPNGASRHGLNRSLEAVRPETRQYELLKEYHSQGLAQSRTSFWFSLIFASIGFLVIMIGLLNVQSEKDLSKQSSSFVSLIAGTVIDAVSALFFVQSNRARQLMSDFFDKLRTDRKLDESLRLIGEIVDPPLRARTQAVLALSFSGVTSTDLFLSRLLNLPETDRGLSTQSSGTRDSSAASESSRLSDQAVSSEQNRRPV